MLLFNKIGRGAYARRHVTLPGQNEQKQRLPNTQKAAVIWYVHIHTCARCHGIANT